MDKETEESKNTSPRHKSPLKLALFITGTIMLVLLIVLFLQNQQFKQELNKLKSPPANQITTLASPLASVISDPTSDWKTYTNNLLKYTVKYPQDWLLLDLTQGKQIEIYYQPDKTKPVGEILIEVIDSSTYSKELGSTQAAYIMLIAGNTAKCKTDNIAKTWCYLNFNNKYLSILIVKEKDSEYNKTLDQILATFRFVEQNIEGQVCGGPVLTPCPSGYTCQLVTTRSGNLEETSGSCVKN